MAITYPEGLDSPLVRRMLMSSAQQEAANQPVSSTGVGQESSAQRGRVGNKFQAKRERTAGRAAKRAITAGKKRGKGKKGPQRLSFKDLPPEAQMGLMMGAAGALGGSARGVQITDVPTAAEWARSQMPVEPPVQLPEPTPGAGLQDPMGNPSSTI